MAHKNNKNSKNNKKVGQKTKKELAEMKIELQMSWEFLMNLKN